jgi:uncharacterized membrane protein YciS (DUF1049 family)
VNLLIEVLKILAVLAVVYVAVTIGEWIAWVEAFNRRGKR